jgi:hypothetical protein
MFLSSVFVWYYACASQGTAEFDTHVINEPAKGGQKGKMKTGAQPVRNRRRVLQTTFHRSTSERSGQFRLNPTKSGYKKNPPFSLLPRVNCLRIRIHPCVSVVKNQLARPPGTNCQPLPTLATWVRGSCFSAVLNSLSINLRRARSCPIVVGKEDRICETPLKTSTAFRLPLRHEMGERAGVRWCSGNRGRSFRTIYKNYQTNPLSFSNLPVNKSNRHSHLMNRPKNDPKITPRLSLHALCASALIRKQVGGAPNFLMFHPCTDCRATARLST